MPETLSRSILKGLSWFVIRFVSLFIITLMITNDTTTAGAVSTVAYSVGAVMYIIHERVWNRIKFGVTH